ncbi:hypothetical protein ACFQVC_35630 [Streptomyces monticola]|uniref:Lipoprotein n=1 Tax=Streptomyces monticola TaxID=2666263 RepID=A0ABW2JVD2_9ACTN
MMTVLLCAVVLLAVAGCGAVFWAARGDAPRSVRIAAHITVAAGEAVARSGKRRRSGGSGGSSSGD